MKRADTSEFFATLIEEIQVDPADKGYKNGDETWKDDQTIFGLLTLKDTPVVGTLDVGGLVKYIAAQNLLGVLLDDGDNLLSPTRSISLATLKFMDNNELTIDFSDPAISQMLGALVQGGIITNDQMNDALGLATSLECRLHALNLVDTTTVAAVTRAREIYDEDPDEWVFAISASGSGSA